jgi:nucleoside-triphosphatase THEP1
MEILFISGDRNSGKTSWAKEHLAGTPGIRGVLLTKEFTGEKGELFRGYNAMDLETGRTVPFARLKLHLPEGWKEKEHFGPFSFSVDGFEEARQWIEKGISSDSLIIDEIGPMELEGRGFSAILSYILNTKQNTLNHLYLIVRTYLVQAVQEVFKITPDRIIQVDNPSSWVL